VDLRAHRSSHDQRRINQQNFLAGIFLNDAAANLRGVVRQYIPVSA
jgi:hypothetical protein